MEKYRNHFHLIKFLHNKYNDLLLADTFRSLALSMVSLFVPIFLYESSYSLFMIASYELVFFTLSIVFHYFIFIKIFKWGTKRTMIASYIFNILFFIILFNFNSLSAVLGKIPYLIYLGVINSISSTLYWSSHHIYFLNTTKQKTSGQKLGLLLSLPTIICIISPFVGGFLISTIGFKFTFFVSVILMTLASFALFFTKEIKIKKGNLDITKIIDKEAMAKNTIYFFQGFNFLACGLIWPLLLFFSSIQIVSIGLFYFFSNISSSAMIYFGGKITDKKGNRSLSSIGVISHGLTLIFRGLVASPLYMAIWQFFGGLSGGIFQVSLESGYLKYSYQDIYNQSMNRELYMHLGRIFLMIIFLIFLINLSLTKALLSILIIAGFTTILLSLITKKDKTIIT